MKTQMSSTALTGSSDRLYLAPVCDTVSAWAGDSSGDMHYHNEVSLAPFLHQAPVPHALISHGNTCDHTLV